MSPIFSNPTEFLAGNGLCVSWSNCTRFAFLRTELLRYTSFNVCRIFCELLLIIPYDPFSLSTELCRGCVHLSGQKRGSKSWKGAKRSKITHVLHDPERYNGDTFFFFFLYFSVNIIDSSIFFPKMHDCNDYIQEMHLKFPLLRKITVIKSTEINKNIIIVLSPEPFLNMF